MTHKLKLYRTARTGTTTLIAKSIGEAIPNDPFYIMFTNLLNLSENPANHTGSAGLGECLPLGLTVMEDSIVTNELVTSVSIYR